MRFCLICTLFALTACGVNNPEATEKAINVIITSPEHQKDALEKLRGAYQ